LKWTAVRDIDACGSDKRDAIYDSEGDAGKLIAQPLLVSQPAIHARSDISGPDAVVVAIHEGGVSNARDIGLKSNGHGGRAPHGLEPGALKAPGQIPGRRRHPELLDPCEKRGKRHGRHGSRDRDHDHRLEQREASGGRLGGATAWV
jgi:hypothetical protein